MTSSCKWPIHTHAVTLILHEIYWQYSDGGEYLSPLSLHSSSTNSFSQKWLHIGYISVQGSPPPPPPPHPNFAWSLFAIFPGYYSRPKRWGQKDKGFFFFWWGGGGLGGNNLHCGLCGNGKLLSFWFSFHSAYCRKIFKDHVLITRVDIGVVSWLDQSRIYFFTMIQINIIQYLQLNG